MSTDNKTFDPMSKPEEAVITNEIGLNLSSSSTDQTTKYNKHLRAIVDIGSNGIRFSISSVDPKHARIFPCLFKDRAAISMFDAQHTKSSAASSRQNTLPLEVLEDGVNKLVTAPQKLRDEIMDTMSPASSGDNSPPSPSEAFHGITESEAIAAAEAAGADKNDIAESVIEDVCNTLVRFKSICEDFRVSDSNVRVVATEATREAPNSQEFRDAILKATGWPVSLLSKSEEGRSGAFGVASSFFEIQGLFMDLGGGSTQLSWITCKDGEFKMSDTPVSLPYGAATLTRRLQRTSRAELFQEIRVRLAAAIETIKIPEAVKKDAADSGGFKMYVSGGGFRGLGHLLLARNDSNERYPLPIINGFSCTGEDISNLVQQQIAGMATPGGSDKKKIFRVSQRRAHQLPAVTLLVSVALEVFPPIRKVLFSQGGVREGVLFHDLPREIRVQDPLYIATLPFAVSCAAQYIEILWRALPDYTPSVISRRLIPALVNVAFVHSSYPRELQPIAALNIASTGVISGADGLSHEVRALIGLALCQRWGGELPEKTGRDSLISVVSPRRLAWWALYVGHLMHVVGGVFPGGTVRGSNLKLVMKEQGNNSFRLGITASSSNPQTGAPMVKARINNLEKKVRKVTKEFGPSNSYKVHVDIEWI